MTSPDRIPDRIPDRVAAIVIGAGPAGLAAAVEVAQAGLSVALIDAGPRLGGQFWRHGTSGADPSLHHDLDVFAGLVAAAERLIAAGHLYYRPNSHVWSVTADDDCVVSAVDRSDVARPVELTVVSGYLLLATGAYDRQLPFPGWDLPGVMTVGAAQSLLKGSGVVVGPRVMVAGTGPFLLPVASSLAAHGADVVGVHEANHPAGWLRRVPVLVAHPRQLREAAGYVTTLARRRVPLRHRSMVIAAHGTDRLEAVTVTRLDRHGKRITGRTQRIAVDVLAIGYGFSTQSELAIAAGAQLRVSGDQTLVTVVDEQLRTSNPRVFAAGEITGVGGAPLAVAEGVLAGAAMARAAGAATQRPVRSLRTRQRKLRRFADAMHQVYPVPAAWLAGLEPDTIVCRCEEVTVAGIDTAIALGAQDGRTVKLLSRSGMGWCQGRECGYATACLIADRTGRPLELSSGAGRPVASPIPLGLVAGLVLDHHPIRTDTRRTSS